MDTLCFKVNISSCEKNCTHGIVSKQLATNINFKFSVAFSILKIVIFQILSNFTKVKNFNTKFVWYIS